MNRSISLRMVSLAIVFLPTMVTGYAQLDNKTRWPTPQHADPLDPIVVKYYINQNGDPGCIGGDEFEAVQRALQAWADASTSKIEFEYQGITSRMPTYGLNTKDGYNVVGWIQSGWDQLGLTHGAVGQCFIWETYYGGSIREVDMFLNSESYNWAADPAPTCPSLCYDVQSVGAHESGHWVGLGNVFDDDDKTMYGVQIMGDVRKRTLHSDDIAGASFLYPYEADWDDAVQPVAVVEPLNLHVDVALAWNPEEASEDFHLACQEGY